jgi:hypothetical protein
MMTLARVFIGKQTEEQKRVADSDAHVCKVRLCSPALPK